MIERADLIKAFIAKAGWAQADVAALAGDASHRRYLRLTDRTGGRAVLMDAAPDKGDVIRPFVEIAAHLRASGLSAPKILATDADHGLLLLEDLGDALFARCLTTEPSREAELYAEAIDVLHQLHRAPCPTHLRPYDSNVTTPLAALVYDWYQRGAAGRIDNAARDRFLQRFTPLLAAFDNSLDVMIQRDYHAENLLWLPERTGVARVGLLDFQDAMRGHAVYDLVSLLQDARRDVSPETVVHMKARFIEGNGQAPTEFEKAYAVFGLQRHLRILGVFSRLCLRDSKTHYIDFMPRVWAHVQTNLAHPVLADVANIIERDIPAPTPAVLARLKDGSGTCAGQ